MGSAFSNRLKQHLKDAGLFAGENPHSFRVAISSTLSCLGFAHEDVAAYVGWRSVDSARRYTQPAATGKLIASNIWHG